MPLTRRELLRRAGALAGTAALVSACGPPPDPPVAPLQTSLPTGPPPTVGPNAPKTIVVILGDDMRFDYRTVLSSLDSSWIDCVNAAIETPMCGPSRAGLFKGAYSIRTGVTGNSFTSLMDDADTIATRVRNAGYRTVLSGKYLNYFPWDLPASYVPPGWDVWNAVGSSNFKPGAMWTSDYVFEVAAQEIRTTARSKPMFLWVAPMDPHLPARPAPRYATAQPALPPVPPSFNEADVSDKPPSIQAPKLTSDEIATIGNDRLAIGRSLLGVDDGVVAVLQALADTGRLDSSHVFFTSDNGYLLGEHRVMGKGEPYEEPVRIPFMVRWPGVIGRTERAVISSVDLSATVCTLAGTTPPGSDGIDLAPLLANRNPVREAAYVEAPRGAWDGVRTAKHKYIDHGAAGRELYDLVADPFEMSNLAGNASHQATMAALAATLNTLRP